MNSATDEWALPHPGSPIRTSSDRCLLAAPRVLSQLATSFIASRRQGIHRALLVARPQTYFFPYKWRTSPGYTRESPYSCFKDRSEYGLASIVSHSRLVEMTGFEPATPCLQ